MSEALFLAFEKLGVLGRTRGSARAPRSSRWSRRRSRSARGARVLGEVTGYGTAFVAPEGETSLIHPSSEAMSARSTQRSSSAGIAASDIDVVVSGVSGLPAFDDAELAAIAASSATDVSVAAPKASSARRSARAARWRWPRARVARRRRPECLVRGRQRRSPRGHRARDVDGLLRQRVGGRDARPRSSCASPA